VIQRDWDEVTGEVVARLGPGLDTVWSLLEAAEYSTLSLSLVDPSGDVQLSVAVADLMEARSELEWIRPELQFAQQALDLSPDGDGSADEHRTAAAAYLESSLELIRTVLRDEGGSMSPQEMAGLARVITLASGAYTRLTGRLVTP
jgi:hypothetical protein